MSTDLVYHQEFDDKAMSALIVGGDLSQLSPLQKVAYYKAFCERVGLDPLTKPFELLSLQGKQILYCTRSGAQQLNKKHFVSHEIISRQEVDGLIFEVVVRAKLPDGRFTDNTGSVPIVYPAKLKAREGWKDHPKAGQRVDPEEMCNCRMKAETKGKRRATLDIIGLGEMDESEIDTVEAEIIPIEPPPAQRKVADGPKDKPAPAKKQEQAPTDKVPTNRDKAIAKAKEWVDNKAEDVNPALALAVKSVLPSIEPGTKITNDNDWKLIANFLEVAIAAKKWAGIKDYKETLKWLDIVKLSAIPQHEGYELRDADVQAIKKQMDQSPFENEVPI